MFLWHGTSWRQAFAIFIFVSILFLKHQICAYSPVSGTYSELMKLTEYITESRKGYTDGRAKCPEWSTEGWQAEGHPAMAGLQITLSPEVSIPLFLGRLQPHHKTSCLSLWRGGFDLHQPSGNKNMALKLLLPFYYSRWCTETSSKTLAITLKVHVPKAWGWGDFLIW